MWWNSDAKRANQRRPALPPAARPPREKKPYIGIHVTYILGLMGGTNCTHLHMYTHLRLHISKSKVKGFDTSCIRITFYGLLSISPNRRILILEHHLQNVSTHLHNYTTTHLHIYTHLRLHLSKSKVKGFHTSCIRISLFWIAFHFSKS